MKHTQARRPTARAQQEDGDPGGQGIPDGQEGEGDDDGGGGGASGDGDMSSVVGGPSGEGEMSGGVRVVQRDDGMRVEEMSAKRRGKQRVVVAPARKVHGRSKMPKGSRSVQWTAVAREAYIQQQRRFERGEGGGVT